MQEAKTTNIVKQVCQELGINQAELAIRLGIGRSAISKWNNGNIPVIAKTALELLIENHKQKNELKILDSFTELLTQRNKIV